MPECTITHQNGRTEPAEARDIVDLVFSYRGNYKSIIKIEENEKVPEVPEWGNIPRK